MAAGSSTTGDPLSQGRDQPFTEATVTFAIDRSGSTQGRTLGCEWSFVSRVSKLLDTKGQAAAKVIPWNNVAANPIPLDDLSSIFPDGGTQPASILANTCAKDALLGSSLWFLMTDGLISESSQRAFANQIPLFGIHGTSCISVIFGTREYTAASCNISVGVSLFAICPDCLFLFYDTRSEEIIIMQAKGTFSSLLPNGVNPVIDDSTSWSRFPRLSLESLADVTIPAPRRLKPDEIALQGSLTVNFNDLWNDKLSRAHLEQIFSDPVNIQTINMTSGSRGQQNRFQGWVQQQQLHIDNPLTRRRDDIGGEAERVFRGLEAGSSSPKAHKERLRRAHAENMRAFLLSCDADVERSLERKRRTESACSYSETAQFSRFTSLSEPIQSRFDSMNVTKSERPSKVPKTTLSSRFPAKESLSQPSSLESYTVVGGPANTSGLSQLMAPPSTRAPALLAQAQRPESGWGDWADKIKDKTLLELLWRPGFRIGQGSFKGTCSNCGAENVTLAWLFRNRGFQPSSQEELDHPLCAGRGLGCQSLSEVICCDPCSTYYDKPGAGGIISAFPMARYRENSTEYNKILSNAFCCSPEDAIQSFISVLLSRSCQTQSTAAFLDALQWTCDDLLNNAEIVHRLSLRSLTKEDAPDRATMAEAVKKGLARAKDPNSFIARYPLYGFLTILRIASFLNMDIQTRRAAAFRRYLFALTENFVEARAQAALEGKQESIRDRLRMLLWQEELDDDMVILGLHGRHDYEQARKISDLSRARVPSLPMTALRGTPLLSEEAGALLEQREEFLFLGTHATCATAVFVHTLVDVAEKHEFETPWDLFRIVLTRKELTPIFAVPEGVGVNEVAGILQSLSL